MNLDAHIALARAHPHDFTIQYPPRREYFMDCFADDSEPPPLGALKTVLLYVHVPFCRAKCFYCNFAVDTRRSEQLQERYVRALCRELRSIRELLNDDIQVPGIDIGGGTPTLLSTELLVALLTEIEPWVARSRSRFPLSIETTPSIAANEPDKLRVLVAQGVHRISVGVQSTNDTTLAQVNRREQRSQVDRALSNLHAAGFQRVNADLIFGLPNQSTEDFAADLNHVIDAGVDSVTTYDCLYRGKGRAMTRKSPSLPSPDDYRRLYDLGFATLIDAGFHAPYGSVNFCRHADETGTSPYFEGRLLDGLPFLGVGNYATSLIGDQWWFAPYSTGAWLERVEAGETAPCGDSYRLPRGELIAKQVLFSLSFGRLDPVRFEATHGVSLWEACGPAVDRALKEGWLVPHESGELRIAETTFGCLPMLRSLFYSEGAIGWLAAGV